MVRISFKFSLSDCLFIFLGCIIRLLYILVSYELPFLYILPFKFIKVLSYYIILFHKHFKSNLFPLSWWIMEKEECNGDSQGEHWSYSSIMQLLFWCMTFLSLQIHKWLLTIIIILTIMAYNGYKYLQKGSYLVANKAWEVFS